MPWCSAKQFAKSAAGTTHEFETKCLDETLGHLRNVVGLVRKNRNTKKNWKPKEIEVLIKKKDGSIARLVGKPRDFPSLLYVPIFADTPSMFLPPNTELWPIKATAHRWISNPDWGSPIYSKDLGGEGVGVGFDIDFVAYQRLLAKIAHGVAVAAYGLDGFTPLLRAFILGTEYGFGKPQRQNFEDEPPRILSGDEKLIEHSLSWSEQTISETAYLVVFVRLFANYGAPTNKIFVGTAKNAPKNPIQT